MRINWKQIRDTVLQWNLKKKIYGIAITYVQWAQPGAPCQRGRSPAGCWCCWRGPPPPGSPPPPPHPTLQRWYKFEEKYSTTYRWHPKIVNPWIVSPKNARHLLHQKLKNIKKLTDYLPVCEARSNQKKIAYHTAGKQRTVLLLPVCVLGGEPGNRIIESWFLQQSGRIICRELQRWDRIDSIL